MQLNPSEISELIKNKIQNLASSSEVRTQGTVVSVTDGICRIHGLADVMQGEMLEFPGNTFGLALNLERDSVGAVVLGEYEHISEGDSVKSTGRILEVPVGPELLGRVVNSLGQPIDGKGPITAKETDVIEKVAPGVIWRKSVSQPVQTGLKAIDAMVPIGRGQRELIIGDRQTGKTAVAVDTIINQKGKDIFCVYVAIGQKASTVANVVRKLEEHGAMAERMVGHRQHHLHSPALQKFRTLGDLARRHAKRELQGKGAGRRRLVLEPPAVNRERQPVRTEAEFDPALAQHVDDGELHHLLVEVPHGRQVACVDDRVVEMPDMAERIHRRFRRVERTPGGGARCIARSRCHPAGEQHPD